METTNTNASSGKGSAKASRPTKEEREMKRQQEAVDLQRREERAKQEASKVSSSLEAIRTSDRNCAEHTYIAGKALEAIRRNKLYRIKDNDGQLFKSFKAFMGTMFGISEQYAYMLINAVRVQDELSDAAVAPKYVSEKLLRKLTFLLRTEGGSEKIVNVWKIATDNNPEAIPTDRALTDALVTVRMPGETKRSDSEILNDPETASGDIINLLRRLSTGKAVLGDDDISTLKKRIVAICDEARRKID